MSHGERILIDEIAYASAACFSVPGTSCVLYSLLLCLISHTWAVSVLDLGVSMLTAMTAIGKPGASCYPLNADPAGICRAGVHHDPAASHIMASPCWYRVASGKLVLRHYRREPCISSGYRCFYSVCGSQLSVFSLFHHADDRIAYGTTPSASAGVSGGDDGTGLSAYLCADGVSFCRFGTYRNAKWGYGLTKTSFYSWTAGSPNHLGILTGRPYYTGNGVQRVTLMKCGHWD